MKKITHILLCGLIFAQTLCASQREENMPFQKALNGYGFFSACLLFIGIYTVLHENQATSVQAADLSGSIALTKVNIVSSNENQNRKRYELTEPIYDSQACWEKDLRSRFKGANYNSYRSLSHNCDAVFTFGGKVEKLDTICEGPAKHTCSPLELRFRYLMANWCDDEYAAIRIYRQSLHYYDSSCCENSQHPNGMIASHRDKIKHLRRNNGTCSVYKQKNNNKNGKGSKSYR